MNCADFHLMYFELWHPLWSKDKMGEAVYPAMLQSARVRDLGSRTGDPVLILINYEHI